MFIDWNERVDEIVLLVEKFQSAAGRGEISTTTQTLKKLQWLAVF